MMEHPQIGDNHNAPVFHWCYKRMGEFIPQLVQDGKRPRVMLDYSGCLLHGLRQMGLDDVLDGAAGGHLRGALCGVRGMAGFGVGARGGAVHSRAGLPSARAGVAAPFRRRCSAWRRCGRVRGFSPAEMALPNHPDVCYEFIRTLQDCGYQWLLVQEHTVEVPGHGGPSQHPHLPHRLVARNSSGETASMVAIIKTQGSDTKLVGQMQPYYEAKGLSRVRLGQWSIPPLVVQIADGENGGVMMNEFPPKYLEVMALSSGTDTPPVNVSEYLEYLRTLGVTEEDFPAVQPVMQKRLWDRFKPGAGPDALSQLIRDLEREDGRFHMEGGSWTNNMSWVRGYENVLGPMEAASALFAEKVLAGKVPASKRSYRNALFHLLASQTSCYRYWGSGIWTDYGRELCRRTMEILKHDF